MERIALSSPSESVLNSLIQAQLKKNTIPNGASKFSMPTVAVQQFMVDYTLLKRSSRDSPIVISEAQRKVIWEQVYQIWAVPSLSKIGAHRRTVVQVLDVTLVNSTGQTVNMGSAIDESITRVASRLLCHSTEPVEQQYHSHRQLWDVMRYSGFQRHPGEWWHFSLGDQMGFVNQENPGNPSSTLSRIA